MSYYRHVGPLGLVYSWTLLMDCVNLYVQMKLHKPTSYRLIIITFLISGLGGCCDDYIPFWTIQDMRIIVYDVQQQHVADSTVCIPDTVPFRMIIINDIEYLSCNTLPLSDFFIQQAWALSCPDPGEDGMKDPIASIHVYSNNQFNDIEPGSPLDELVLIENTVSIPEFLQDVESMHPLFGEEINLTFTERPQPSTHRFTVRVELESGQIFSDESIEVTWE
jgi:hypothetical protein